MNLNFEPRPQFARKQVSWFISGRFSSLLPLLLPLLNQSPRISSHHLHHHHHPLPTSLKLLHPSSHFSPLLLPSQTLSPTLKNPVCAGRTTLLTLPKKRSAPRLPVTREHETNAPNVLTQEWKTGPKWSVASSEKRIPHA